MTRRKRRKFPGRKPFRYILASVGFAAVMLAGIFCTRLLPFTASPTSDSFGLGSVPPFSGEPFCVINNNCPFFSSDELTAESFTSFSPLDSLGRCGAAYACLHWSDMPTEPRGEIDTVRPSGWNNVRYDDLIQDKYLYNRCHLIAYMFTGENANPENLITGTRYMNKTGMLPFETQVADYLCETGNHVLYRVTPIFAGQELVARGVLIEACSVEDQGRELMFNVFVYNVYPGIEIDYATGDSRRS